MVPINHHPVLLFLAVVLGGLVAGYQTLFALHALVRARRARRR